MLATLSMRLYDYVNIDGNINGAGGNMSYTQGKHIFDPTPDELAAQLQLDLAEGESWHIEFKYYERQGLETKLADKWKDDISYELAALGSIGGRIYLGITDNGIVKGIEGSHQTWQEKLIERAIGRIKPKVSWKSHYFADPVTYRNIIRIDVLQDEPMYYVVNRPYIREGTVSRPAEPEEVKVRFKHYFAKHEPIIQTTIETHTKADQQQHAIISWIIDALVNILSNLNLYEQKNINNRLDWLKTNLEHSRESIENNLNKIKRNLGEESEFYQGLEAISREILAAVNVRLMLDGGESWASWLVHLQKVQGLSLSLLTTVKSKALITVNDLKEQAEDAADTTGRWLKSIDEYKLSKFTYEASAYAHMLLRLHFLFWMLHNEQKAQLYKEIADELETLSWARTNADYRNIIQALPKLQQKLLLLDSQLVLDKSSQ